MRQQLDAWIDDHREQVIGEIRSILRIPSVEEKATVTPAAPFGQPIADALEYTLSLCGRLGMRTENFQGYAGHADFGDGEEIVAMLGHLDVVPAGQGWTHGPWDADLADGYIWGRGTSDDKGPTYAALFGAKAVLDVTQAAGIQLTRRIRLIFGCDEESGWQCMRHYFGPAGQPKPTLAFTPDADFPLVYAEKGSFTGVARRIVPQSDAPLRVVDFHSGLRPNMVPEEAFATLTGDPDVLDLAGQVLAEVPGITVKSDGESLVVRAQGRSAHGATPQQGDNGAIKLLHALTSAGSAFDDLSGDDMTWMMDLAHRGDTEGVRNGISGSDEITGALTSNLGIVSYEAGVVNATFNVRYPSTWDDSVTGRFRASLAETGWEVVSLAHTPPLYVPLDQEPVKTLLRVYREQTGDMTAPHTIGGRTYATTVAPVGVAFGPSMPGDLELAHQADERIPVERLIECAKIYAQALYELAK